jgi:hypothetical protein
MNLYIVDAGEQSEVIEIDPEIGGPTEYFWAVDLVVARSPGQAHAFVADRYHLHWTRDKVHVFLVARNIRKIQCTGIVRDTMFSSWIDRMWVLGWRKIHEHGRKVSA